MTNEQVRNILLMYHDSLKNDPICPLLPNHEIGQAVDSGATASMTHINDMQERDFYENYRMVHMVTCMKV